MLKKFKKIIISDYKNYKNSLINVRQLMDMNLKMILKLFNGLFYDYHEDLINYCILNHI